MEDKIEAAQKQWRHFRDWHNAYCKHSRMNLDLMVESVEPVRTSPAPNIPPSPPANPTIAEMARKLNPEEDVSDSEEYTLSASAQNAETSPEESPDKKKKAPKRRVTGRSIELVRTMADTKKDGAMAVVEAKMNRLEAIAKGNNEARATAMSDFTAANSKDAKRQRIFEHVACC
jgi:hypothetical protein